MNEIAVPSPQHESAKTARIAIKVEAGPVLPKPEWIRVRVSPSENFREVKRVLREANLHTVCGEVSCPNIGECFGKGTATFMVLGDLCTRRCPFCDVAHRRPSPPDPLEPQHLAHAVARLGLKHVVITSVDRDDLRDGGATHFAECIRAVRRRSPDTRIEVLTPDFRGRSTIALDVLASAPPDVMNHNLETVPQLYRQARPGADYGHSLQLLQSFKQRCPDVPTKSGLMLGLGETDGEVLEVLHDMRVHGVDMLTVGQYLQPRPSNLAAQRYVEPRKFEALAVKAWTMGSANAACGRLRDRADKQAAAAVGT